MIMKILKLSDGYVTRDKKNNSLWLFFEHKPLREELDGGFWYTVGATKDPEEITHLPGMEEAFKDLKWEDEPAEVTVNIIKK